MLINGKSIAGIVLFATLFSFSERINAQEEIDTSDYVPSFYSGALEYNLLTAAAKGYSSEIVRLVEKGADINVETVEGVTPLILAVVNQKPEAVRTLLSGKPELDTKTLRSETALLIAVKDRNFEISEMLIRAGADMDLSDNHRATPLHYASLYGYYDMVDLLLYYDASVDKRTEEGSTPLMISVRAGYPDIADLLAQKGANIDLSDNEGFTPFLMAAYYGDTLIMDMLHHYDADMYAINNRKLNALTLAITGNNIDAARYLIKTGNWLKASDAINPYTVASKYRRKEMIEILENNKIPGQAKVGIDQAAISVSSRFGANDYFTGLSLSFKDPYLNAGFIAGCDIKLWYTRVFINREDLFYQYLDKGSVAYAGLFKDFAFTNKPEKSNYSVSASLLAGYAFGNKLKGTSVPVEEKFIIIPSISLKMTKLNYSFYAGLEYQKTEFYQNGPVWIRLGFSYNHFFDKVRAKVKPLKWQ